MAPALRLVARLRGYRRQYVVGDLVAGLLVAALAIPQALGYSAVAGVPAQVGLYTLPPALLAYALMGSSRVLYVGPVATVTVLTGSIVRTLADGDPQRAAALTSALAIVAGLVLVLAGLARIGWVAQFLSEPIVTGFVAGLVVLIVLGEIPQLLGLPGPQGALLDRVVALARGLPDAHLLTLGIGISALVVLFAGFHFWPRLPWSLAVLVVAIGGSRQWDLSGRGVAVVGEVAGGLRWPSLPDIALSDIGPLVTGGLAVAAVGIAEGLAAARTFAKPGHAVLRDDTEVVANGVADLASGLFGGMGVAGSLSKTAANARAGAHTQMSSVVSAFVVLLMVLLATGFLADLPRVVLSAVVIRAVWGLVHPSTFRRFRAVRRNDFVASMMALLGVLVLGPLNGLLVAIGQSLLGLVYRSMQVSIDEMGKVQGEKAAWGAIGHDPEHRVATPGVMVLRPDSPIFWANANHVFELITQMVAARPETRAVILDLEASNQMDTTTVERFLQMVQGFHEQGIEVFLVRVFDRVREVFRRCGVFEVIATDHVWHSISAGVKVAKQLVPDDVAAGVAPMDDDADLGEEERIATRKR